MSDLYTLDEALNYLNTGITPVNEGIVSIIKNLFKKKDKSKNIIKLPTTIYYSSEKDYNPGTVLKGHYSKYNLSIAEQVKWDAFIYDLGYFDYGKLKVNKKNVSKLEKQEINLYKCSFIKAISYLMGDIDEYNFKIEEKIFSGSIAEALKKYNIEYEVVDTTSMERERKIIAKKAFSIAKQVLDEAKKLPEYDDCYFLSEGLYKDKEYEEYNIDEFYTGIENEIYLIEYDITDFKNSNPNVKTERDHLHSDEFATVSNFIYNELKKRIESDNSINGTVDYYGDWDGGPYGLELKK